MLSPKGLIQKIKSRQYHHIYLLVIKDSYELNNLISLTIDELLDEDEKDFNFEKIDLKNSSLEELINLSKTPPMFGESKVILASNGNDLKDSSLESFEEYIKKPNEGCITFITANNTAPNTKWVKTMKAAGYVVVFEELHQKNVQGWIANQFSKRGIKAEPDALSYMAEIIGNNLEQLNHQINKVEQTAQKDTLITLEMIKKSVLRSRRHNYWELTDALANKSLSKSILILNNMLDDGEPEPVIFGILNNFFKKLLLARKLYDLNLSVDKICDTIGQRYYKEKFISQVRGFSSDILETLFKKLQEMDEHMKTGISSPRRSLERFTYDVCQKPTSL